MKRKKLSARSMRWVVEDYERQLQATIVDRNRLAFILMAALAQHGGEITVTAGTIDQIHEGMGLSIVDGGAPGERVIRLIQGDMNAQPASDNDNHSGSGAESTSEEEAAYGITRIPSPEEPALSASSSDGPAQAEHRDYEVGDGGDESDPRRI